MAAEQVLRDGHAPGEQEQRGTTSIVDLSSRASVPFGQ